MRMRPTGAIFLLLLFTGVQLAEAGPIIISPHPGHLQVKYFEPVGQSFTAEDPFVTAALHFYAINPSFSSAEPIRYDLLEGHGTGGTLLASSTFVLLRGFSGFYDVDFSSVRLLVGSQYSLVASVVGESPYWGLNRSADVYAGGASVFPPHIDIDEEGLWGFSELALRVLPIAAPVPDSGPSLLLLGIGGVGVLVGVAAWRKRRQ